MLLLLYAQVVLVTVVILPWYGFSLHVPIYTALTLLALISHSRAQFTNPGAVPLDMIVSDAYTTLFYTATDGVMRGEIFESPPLICSTNRLFCS